jgi:hypothetical protein
MDKTDSADEIIEMQRILLIRCFHLLNCPRLEIDIRHMEVIQARSLVVKDLKTYLGVTD